MISTVPQDTAAQAHVGDYAGTATTADFGNVPAEFEALLSKCGVYELQWRAGLSLSGSDRVRWLNGIVTNNVRDLSPGQGVYAFLLNPQGRILGDLYAYNRRDSLLIHTDRSQLQKVLALFDRYIVMDEVEVSDMSGKISCVGITGPTSREVLRAAGLDFANLQRLNFVDATWRNLPLTVIRGDNSCVESYEVWLSVENTSTLRDALEAAGARPVGATALNFLRIAAGIPQFGLDIRERDLPQETGQQRALHFTKGCYIGQEIVERIRSRGSVHRNFTGFTVEGPLPATGTKIRIEGKEVGEITSWATLPVGFLSMERRRGAPGAPSSSAEYPVGLGYIRREVGTPGKQIEVENIRLTVANVPFTEVFEH